MKNYVTITLLFGATQLKRSFRDPVTIGVLLGVPVLLILVFGALLGNTSNISLRVAVINNSDEQFAADFEKNLSEVKVLKLPEETMSFNDAKEAMENDELDGIIEMPAGFGTRESNVPRGDLKIYYDQSDAQTGDLVASVMRSVVDSANEQLVEVPMPIEIQREPINVTEVKAIDNIFAMFTGIAVMMAGVFGVASTLAADKKAGILRRLRVTLLRPGQIILGTMISYAVIGILGVALMAALAVGLFDLNMRGDWLTFGMLSLAGIIMMLGFGLTIGGVAKNSTQADIGGQIVFLGSLALSGVWFPRALMPEFLQGITTFLPLTPIIDG
ncbi:MAG TPA: ABC transporter permease, partial [Nitrososphaera sp.]|nr:ABC transporter permease [Nitrososphaera sp.]